MENSPAKTTIETSLKAEVFGIGGGVKVSRDYIGDSPANLPFGALIRKFFAGETVQQAVPDLRESDLVASLEERAKNFVIPNVEQYRVDSYWTSLELQPAITSIVSGKGGVGKSTIALGLTEAFSREENVLLIDFDLHN